MERLTIKGFFKRLASKKSTPGGGSVAALSGAMAAGLVSKAAKISKQKEIAEKSERFMSVLVTLISRDAEAFEKILKKEPSIEEALKYAAEIPLQTAKYSYEILKLAETLAKNCNPKVITDVGMAVKLAEAAVEGALLNVKINLASIKDKKFKKEMQEAVEMFYLTGYQARAILSRIQACLR